MEGLPFLGVSGGLILAQAFLPKEEVWAKVTRTAMIGFGIISAGVGLYRGFIPKHVGTKWTPEEEKVEEERLRQSVQIAAFRPDPRQIDKWSQFADHNPEFSVKNVGGRKVTFYVISTLRDTLDPNSEIIAKSAPVKIELAPNETLTGPPKAVTTIPKFWPALIKARYLFHQVHVDPRGPWVLSSIPVGIAVLPV